MVFSIDLIRTLVFGVMGDLVASLNGLKLKRVDMMRLDVFGRWRIRMDNVFNVASTTKVLLEMRGKPSVNALDIQDELESIWLPLPIFIL